jgi:TolB-like protein/DNA-binding SARP family transcriptional activator
VLTLKLLGTAALERPDGPVTGRAAEGRRLALLAVLALARGRPVRRDRLVALLWPESPPDRARPHLSDTLYILRGALGDDAIRSAGDGLVLDAGAITSDVATFERLLDDGQAEAAVGRYGGPLLDGFHLSDAAEFERWLDAERAKLGERYAVALESLAEASETEGRFADAAGWWRRRVAHDPYSGRAALRLMRALEAAGDRAGALQHARVHARLLRDEFDTEPDAEVQAFAERLRLDPPVHAAAEPLAPLRARAPRPRAPEYSAPPEPGAPASGGVAPRAGRRRGRVYAAAAALLALSVLVAYGIVSARPSGRSMPARSVGVLPFVNLSPDPDNAYFSDGLSEQVISALSRIDGLQVAARTSSFALRDRSLDTRAIADTLGVAAVLEGSVRKDGNRLRVSAQLIDAATGYHIWSDDYDRELRDVFAVQDEIAQAIAAALELRLVRRAAPLRGRRAPDLVAYDLYLRGLYLRNSMSADALRQAAEYFDRVIELEPDFALAWAAKASVVAPQVYYDHVPREQGFREMRELVRGALDRDSTLGEAHAALGILRLFYEWDWDGAERALRRAIELNPSDPHAHHHLANYLLVIGRFDDAIAARQRAADLDPLNPRTRYTLGNNLAHAGQYDRALAEYRRAQQLDPGHPFALGYGPELPVGPAMVFLWQGRYDEVVEEYLKVATLRGATTGELDAMRTAYAASGMPGFWRSWLDMELRQFGGAINPLRMARIQALMGDTAQAFDWLDRAYDERNLGLVFLRSGPGFRDLLSHPRVARIVREMKFPAR